MRRVSPRSELPPGVPSGLLWAPLGLLVVVRLHTESGGPEAARHVIGDRTSSSSEQQGEEHSQRMKSYGCQFFFFFILQNITSNHTEMC